MPITQYNKYMKNSNNYNLNKNNYQQNYSINEQINVNKSNLKNKNNISFNEIHTFKQYLQNLSKEELNNLPYNIKSELKDIFNILYQKLNE